MNIFFKSFPILSTLLITSILIVYSVIALSCKDENNQTFTSNIVFPDSLISFNNHVEPLFRQTCVASQCHGGTQPAANLNLEYDAWHSLIDYQPQIVIPHKSNDSPLVMYIDGSGRLSPRMPLNSQPLTANQINGVKKWIDEGAKNN
jgi:hypothetical protein